ncbi:MAG: glycosyl transferase [Lentisphaeria bacterium]|nr:glycosyl transferase [Lentisphaeria bacterium]
MSELNSNEYSPVIIPTLCRYEHFRTCLESLRRCTHAEKTDIYIGLDYPAKESHWEGYRKIDDYLKTVSGFRKLVVFRREVNYGSGRNVDELRQVVLEHNESYIYMEDDIEVSPNFLDFIHKGLLKFQHDSSVLAVCGFSYHNDFPCGESNYYRQRVGYSAWGVGMTRETHQQMISRMTRWYSIRKLLNPLSLWKVIHLSWGAFLFLMMHAINPKLRSDYVLSNYMLFEKMDTIMPAISLVRNNGFDGSGEHCTVVEEYRKSSIDPNDTFEFHGDGRDGYEAIYQRLRVEKRVLMGFGKMLGHIRSMFWVRICRVFHG